VINRELVRVTERGKGGIWVEGVQQSACNSCSAKSGCGQHSLSKLGRPVRLWVDTPEQFEIGEIVELTLPQGSLAASAAALYGLPLLGLIAGAVAGHQLWGESASVFTALVGLAVGFLAARVLSSRFRDEWQPTVSRERPPLLS